MKTLKGFAFVTAFVLAQAGFAFADCPGFPAQGNWVDARGHKFRFEVKQCNDISLTDQKYATQYQFSTGWWIYSPFPVIHAANRRLSGLALAPVLASGRYRFIPSRAGIEFRLAGDLPAIGLPFTLIGNLDAKISRDTLSIAVSSLRVEDVGHPFVSGAINAVLDAYNRVLGHHYLPVLRRIP